MSRGNKMSEKDAQLLKPKKTFSLKLTLAELVHLRDLFSISLPVDLRTTVSQSLAFGQGRQLVETKLWNKIVNLCKDGSVPLDEGAPDFIVTVTAPPELGVFEVAAESVSEENSEEDEESEEDDEE